MKILKPLLERLNKLPSQWVAALIIFAPIVGVVIAIIQWEYVQGIDIFLFFAMYLLTGLSITVGFHRYFTHHSFKTKIWMRRLLHICGSMAGEGPLIYWVATHRNHHRFTDVEGDPHSPILETDSLKHKIKGFFHAHMGWMLAAKPESSFSYAIDLLRDRKLVEIDSAYLVWLMLGLIIPAVIGGLWTQTLMGVWMGFLWGGLVRMAVCQHVTWGVNSICHIFGQKNYKTKDNSRDNFILGVLALGEGFHNTHHAFPTSARHGLKWWQFDLSYYVIRLFSVTSLATDIRLPHRDPTTVAATPE